MATWVKMARTAEEIDVVFSLRRPCPSTEYLFQRYRAILGHQRYTSLKLFRQLMS